MPVVLWFQDGLWDPYNNCHMGVAAEECSKKFSFDRATQAIKNLFYIIIIFNYFFFFLLLM